MYFTAHGEACMALAQTPVKVIRHLGHSLSRFLRLVLLHKTAMAVSDDLG